MKAVILVGGFGTRLSEETQLKPKPMVEIGGMPILWHIMKIYSHFGVNEFVLCCGYKGYMIKEYFSNYFLHMSDITIDMNKNDMIVHQRFAEPWQVTLVDTGIDTQTGGRLKRVKKYVDSETFCFTYGDGLSDVNINDLIEFHKSKRTTATVTAVQPPGRFGILVFNDNKVVDFTEKPQGDGNWINGGFFVLEPSVFDYLKRDSDAWEKEPMMEMAKKHQLSAYKHKGFWRPMDTLRDKRYLDELWFSDKAPWKLWK